MKKSHHTATKLVALALLLALTLPVLVSCKSRPIPADKLALTPVGTVDGREIYYEELYFLAKSYLPAIEPLTTGKEAINSALDATIREHIVTNAAILRLCENEGLLYDENDKTLKEAAQTYVDQLIESKFDGNRDDYRASIAEIGMTDHYLRYNTMVDELYGQLPARYAAQGLTPTENDAIRAYVKNNFVRTWHIAILVENGESYEENRAKAEQALALLQSGEKSMYQLIGSTFNEDFSLTTTDGYYFPRGAMDQTYEDAAFSLAVGETSGIVETIGTSNRSNTNVTCFYIIERLRLDEDYIDSHLTELSDTAANAFVASKLEAVTSTLSFVPNEFYSTLDLSALEAPGDGVDWPMILCIGGIVLAAGGAAATAVILVIRKKKKKALPAAK